MLEFIVLALTLPATIYGTGESNCGDLRAPVVCSEGAITASGEPLDSSVPSAAVPAPVNQRMRVKEVGIRHVVTGECVLIRINDKASPRWIGVRGLDLTPAALEALGIKVSPHWSGKLESC